jgi:hypothetical protein
MLDNMLFASLRPPSPGGGRPRRRLQGILQRGEEAAPSPEELRGWRAVEVLEHIGTAEARDVLDRLGREGADVGPPGRRTRGGGWQGL